MPDDVLEVSVAYNIEHAARTVCGENFKRHRRDQLDSTLISCTGVAYSK